MLKGKLKPMIIMLIIAAVVLGGVVGFQTFKNKMIAQGIKGSANPPQTVSTTVAVESTWQPTVEAVGSFSASKQAALSAEVGGLVTAIYFDSGQRVKDGQPLVELNPAPLKAQLAQLEAQAALAEVNLKRDEAQLKIQAISQSAVDTDAATLKSAQAQVKTQKALIAQKTIAAPFSGQLGIRQVNLGQYLAPGSAVVTLQKLDPMDVDFTVPQNQIDLIHVGMKAQVETSARARPNLRRQGDCPRAAGGHIHAQPQSARPHAQPRECIAAGGVRHRAHHPRRAAQVHHSAERGRGLQPLRCHRIHRE